MSERVISFFELVGDSSLFDAAFTKAKTQAMEFAAGFKASASSVEADANRMGIALERGLATGSLSRQQVNAQISQRLRFYGAPADSAESGTHVGGGGLGSGLALSTGLFASVAIIGGLAGISALLTQQVSQYAQHSAAILRDSEAIGINAQQLQVWEKIAGVVGIDQQSMTLDFERFAKNLAEGAPALKATGVTLKDLGITSTDVGQAILQLADYFHSHNDQAQKAAIASALFGRSGAELIPILDQGSQAFRDYQDALQKMGVLMSNSDLVMGARAQTAITQFSNAFEGAKSRLIAAALPGFTIFFQQLSNLLVNNGQLWTQIGRVISDVVSFMVGIVAGLSGSKLDLSTPPSDAAAKYEGLGGAAKDAAAGIGSAAGATKSMTDLIDDQIAALQDQKRAQDEVYDAQKAALQDQLDTLHDVTDSRRRSGEDIVTYERRLHELGLQDQIKAIDKTKTAYDRGVDDHIAALNREKQAVKDASGAMGASLAAGISSGMNLGLTAADQATVKLNQKFVDFGSKFAATVKSWFLTLIGDGDLMQSIHQLGRLMGDDLAKGMVQGLVDSIPGGKSVDMGRLIGNFVSRFHAAGTITSGPEVAMIGEAGTEVVLPTYDRSRSLALMEQSGMAALARSAGGGHGGGSAGPALVVNFNGPVADELVAERVWRRLEKKARDRGFSLQGGFG